MLATCHGGPRRTQPDLIGKRRDDFEELCARQSGLMERGMGLLTRNVAEATEIPASALGRRVLGLLQRTELHLLYTNRCRHH